MSGVGRLPRWQPLKPEVVAVILNSGNQRTSGNVGSVTDESGAVRNVWVAAAIGLQTHFVQ